MKARMKAREGRESSVGGWRLGLYDPDPSRPGFKPVGRLYRNTPRDRAAMAIAVQKFNELAERDSRISLCLGIFPVEG